METFSMQSSRLIVVLAMLLASPALATAQLRFAEAFGNLGELRGGPVYTHRFEFINDSTRPLEIIDFRLGCGCLQPQLDKRVYQPGEKGTLLMHIRTLGQPDGVRTWQAQVQYRSANQLAECALTVAANLRNEITVEPSLLAMTVETTLRQEITIKDQRKTPMKINNVLASSPALRVTVQPTVDGVTKVFVDVSRSALTANKQNEMLSIYSDDPHYRLLQVPITLTKAQRTGVSATPESVTLIGTGSQLVRLRGNNDQMVRVERADADHSALTCTYAAGPGNDATLKIVVNASRLTTPSAIATVTVRLAEPAGAVVAIPVVMRKE